MLYYFSFIVSPYGYVIALGCRVITMDYKLAFIYPKANGTNTASENYQGTTTNSG